jgi:hypothetical protein
MSHEIRLDLHKGISDVLLPGFDDVSILAVGANIFHSEATDIVEVSHILFVLLCNGGKALLFNQTLVADVCLTEVREVLCVSTMLLAVNSDCRCVIGLGH